MMETEEAKVTTQSESSPTNALPTETPSPRFAPLSKVYARDNDGLLYVAVIRRQIYGPNYNTQVLLGMKSAAEAEAAAAVDPSPQWHYFVHFNQWSVNFDRWVQEDLIFPMDDAKVQEYAERLRKAHRALQVEMQKALPKKKGKVKIDGLAFLQAWRVQWDRINDELGFSESFSEDLITDDTTPTPSKQAARPKRDRAQPTWTKNALMNEQQLQSTSLTAHGRSRSNDIPIPSAFKRDLVEQWEMICQCGMLPVLPCKVSVRQALDHYVESKISGGSMTALDPNNAQDVNGSDTKTEATAKTPPTEEKMPGVASDKAAAQITNKNDDVGVDGANYTVANEQVQQWRIMADGIARFFDEALPSRLLYKEEKQILDSFEDEFATKHFSETFGCGHLLRLFVQLPDILEEHLADSQRKPIVAKINDFVRFLHKNHGKLLTQRYRKPSVKRSSGVQGSKRTSANKKARRSSASATKTGGATSTAEQGEDSKMKDVKDSIVASLTEAETGATLEGKSKAVRDKAITGGESKS